MLSHQQPTRLLHHLRLPVALLLLDIALLLLPVALLLLHWSSGQ